jgi:hypothetical protein
MLETEALEAATESLKRWNSGKQPAPIGFRA